MTRYPYEASEVRRFVPPSLANISPAPTFLLKPATRRDQRLVRRLAIEQGLSRHSEEEVRNETLTALREAWSADLVDENVALLTNFWADLDAYRKKLNDEGKSIIEEPFEHDMIDSVRELGNRIAAVWAPLRKMMADNMEFAAESPTLYARALVTGWEDVGVPFSKADGIVPHDRMDDVADWLSELETDQQGKVDGLGLPGTAFMELTNEAGRSLFLSKEEEKNSDSSSPTSSSPDSSSTATTNMSSKAKNTPDEPET